MRQRIPYVLDLVGLTDKSDALPDEISGGEQQRVAIARALINNPQMIIADEPTGNLDPTFSLEIMTLLERINAMGTTMLVVTHEKDLVNRFGKRVIAIKDGELIRDAQGGYVSTSCTVDGAPACAVHTIVRREYALPPTDLPGTSCVER